MKTAGNPVQIAYSCSLYNTSLTIVISAQIYVDGQPVGSSKLLNQPVASYITNLSDFIIVPLAAGVHKIDVYWSVSGGVGTLSGVSRNLSALEL